MEQENKNLHTASVEAPSKGAWVAPVLTKLRVEDAESGNNISENGATGS